MSRITPQNLALFEEYMAKKIDASKAVGMAVAVIDKDGNTLYQHFHGCRDRDNKLPVDENTVFGLASITKSFTALAITQLVDKGLVDVFAPVQRYVPEFKNPDIMMWQLLSHCAGFMPMERMLVVDIAKELGLTPQDGDYAYSEAISKLAAQKLIDRMNSQTKFTGRPGENFSYSNDGFALLGDIVGRLGGEKTHADYLKKHVLAPLGMARSGCDFIWNDANVTRQYEEKDGVINDESTLYSGAFALMGEGNMKSTLGDMKKYVGMYLRRGVAEGGRRIASSYGIGQMVRPRVTERPNDYYCFGLNSTAMGEMTMVSHGGNLPGFATNMCWSYEAGAGAIVLCNTSGAASGDIARAALRMAAGMAPGEPEDFVPFKWDDELMDKACGRYASDEGVEVTLKRNGDVFDVVIVGQPTTAVPINAYMARMKFGASSLDVSLLINDDGVIWAIFGGGRVIPKAE